MVHNLRKEISIELSESLQDKVAAKGLCPRHAPALVLLS